MARKQEFETRKEMEEPEENDIQGIGLPHDQSGIFPIGDDSPKPFLFRYDLTAHDLGKSRPHGLVHDEMRARIQKEGVEN
jgi:hypothetical protein